MNKKLLKEFTEYCKNHKNERFWQALRNWSKFSYIFVGEHLGSEIIGGKDTFYFTTKRK